MAATYPAGPAPMITISKELSATSHLGLRKDAGPARRTPRPKYGEGGGGATSPRVRKCESANVRKCVSAGDERGRCASAGGDAGAGAPLPGAARLSLPAKN